MNIAERILAEPRSELERIRAKRMLYALTGRCDA